MPQWDKCDPIEVSIVPGECGASKVLSETSCGIPPLEISVSYIPEVSVLPADPPTFVLATPPYPVATTDGVESGFTFVDGTIWKQPVEALNSGFALLPSELREVVQTYSSDPEAVDSGFAMSSGTIQQVVIRYTSEPDAVDSGFALSSGTIQQVVIRYTWPAEAVESGFALLSGELT